VFLHDVLWDGAAFFTVGEVDDQGVAWRVGTMLTSMR
jgi:hypothetical protein